MVGKINEWLKRHKQTFLELFFVGLISSITQGWALTSSNKILMDDITFLYISKFGPLNFSILPSFAYNDRPIRDYFNSALFWLFGSNYQAQHLVLFVVHLCSAVILYILLTKIITSIDSKKKTYKFLPLLTTLIFAAWPKAFAVFWIAAANDLLVVFFFTITALLYFYYNCSNTKNKTIYLISSVITLWLALRSKESAAFIPFILIIGKIALSMNGQRIQKLLSVLKSRLNILDGIMAALSLAVITKLALLQTGEKLVKSASSPYQYTLSPITILDKLYRYTLMYFDFSGDFMSGLKITNSNFSYLATIVVLFLLGMTLYQAFFKKSYLLLALFAMYVLAILTVLPLANMQHVLYLYFPSLFLSLIVAIALYELFEILKINKNYHSLPVFATGFLLIILSTTNSVVTFRNFWEDLGNKDYSVIDDLRKMPKPEKNTVFYITNVKEGYHTFYYANGGIINIIYDDASLKVAPLNTTPEKGMGLERVLKLDYEKGRIYETN